MKHLTLPFLAVLLALPVLRADPQAPSPAPARPSPAAVAAYPLSTCVVSGEALEGGDMGGPIDYLHKEDGKPDRLVRFCCKSCIRDFKKDPAKYLRQIDEAAAAEAGSAKPAAPDASGAPAAAPAP